MIAEIVRRAQVGEEAAFAELFSRYRQQVYRLCLRLTHDHGHAEDLLQETFLQVYLKISSFRGKASFTTWLYRVAFNQAMMSLRRKRLPCVELDALESGPAIEFRSRDSALETVPLRQALGTAIASLPPKQKEIFLLRYVDGQEHHEVASLLGCSVGNSKSQSYKAIHKMRKAMRAQR